MVSAWTADLGESTPVDVLLAIRVEDIRQRRASVTE